MRARLTLHGLLAFWRCYLMQRRHLRASRREALRTAWTYGPVR